MFSGKIGVPMEGLAEFGRLVAAQGAVLLKNEGEALPLKKGEKVGRMDIYSGEEKIGSCTLVCDRNIEKADFLTYYIRKVKSLF